MNALTDILSGGYYARKQLFSRSRLISWSHRRRFRIALQLAERFTGKTLLDYGSGDGSFLAMLLSGANAPSMAVGAEVNTRAIADCRKRLGNLPALSFITVSELDNEQHAGAYDTIVCMEVLEHVLNPGELLEKFSRLLSPSGRLLISVPVETGIPLLVKQSVRRVAGWRGIGDYPGMTSYKLRELAKGLFASGKRQHIVRPVHENPGGDDFHDHKGFNWMLLRNRLEQEFEIERIVASPLTWLSPHLASQVWFLARKRS